MVSVGAGATLVAVARQIPETGVDDDDIGLGIEAQNRHDGVLPVVVPRPRHEEEADVVMRGFVEAVLSDHVDR